MNKKFTLNVMTALALAATLLGSASFAQDAREQAAKPGVLPCCNCLNETKIAQLHTGSVPWTVKGPGAATAIAAVNASNVAWTTTTIPNATWLSPVGNPTAPGNYVYQTTVDTRNCTLNSTVTISGKFLADNIGSVLVNGNAIATSGGTPNYGFLPGSLTNFSYTLPSGGVHTITINAYNAGGPTGMIAEVRATRDCRGNPERDRRAELARPSALAVSAVVPEPCTTCSTTSK